MGEITADDGRRVRRPFDHLMSVTDAMTDAVDGPRIVLRLFAAAREAAGTGREDVWGETVGDVLDRARVRHGEHFAAILARCGIWVNGEPAAPDTLLAPGDEVAVLPPVSGGAGAGVGAGPGA